MPRRSQSGVRRRDGAPAFDDAGDGMRGTLDAACRCVKAARAMTPALPVLVGAGQIVDRPSDPHAGLEPLALMEAAARRAIDDAGGSGLNAGIDTVAVVTNV